jgi:MGT family glycosyltransferase
VTWDGGGNLQPAIGLAQELVARGHSVRFLGYAVQRTTIEALGFEFSVLRRSGTFNAFVGVEPEQRLAALIRNVWACPEHLQDIPDALAEHPADLLVVDFSMNGALAFAALATVPVAVLAHSGIGALIPPPESPNGAARLHETNELRATAGVPRIDRLNQGWDDLLTLVATIPELDPAAATAAQTVRYVGPIRERQLAASWESPWKADDDHPLVLVSFSTTRIWDKRSRIANTLEALAEEPVRVLISTGDAADVGPLPTNATAQSFVPHDQVLPLAALMVTHCGHGTVTACLSHGVPIVGLPNPGADQPFLANRVQQLGAGVALAGEAGSADIRAAARKVLGQPNFRAAASRLATVIHASAGAAGAAAELEQLSLT